MQLELKGPSADGGTGIVWHGEPLPWLDVMVIGDLMFGLDQPLHNLRTGAVARVAALCLRFLEVLYPTGSKQEQSRSSTPDTTTGQISLPGTTFISRHMRRIWWGR